MVEYTEHEIKHRKILREGAPRCVVLMKKDGLFPIESPCKVALYGNGARNTVKGGTGSGNVYSRGVLSIEEALEKEGFIITTKEWLDAYDLDRKEHHSAYIENIKAEAKRRNVSPFVVGFGKIEPEYENNIRADYEGDICIYVLSRNSGEGNDRELKKGEVLLTDTESRLINQLNEDFDRFMLVLNVGGVIDISPVKNVKNILYLSQLGMVTGEVLSDIILGKSNPSGKLSTTWAKIDDYKYLNAFGDKNDTRYTEGIYVGYRYFDSAKVEPVFPFGHGLSYTEFSIETKKVKLEGSQINIQIEVENVGNYPGREVVQIYMSKPQGKLDQPYQELVAFYKTRELIPGASNEIEIEFDLKDIAGFSKEEEAYVLEKGIYALRIGNSSKNTTLVANITLDTSVKTKVVRNCFDNLDISDDCYYEKNELIHTSDEPLFVINLNASDIETEYVEYSQKIDEIDCLDDYSNEELAYLCLGAYNEDSIESTIGNGAIHISGAAGETTNHLENKLDNKYLVLADGPAGLRLSPQYVQAENNMQISAVRDLPDGLDEIIDPAIVKMFSDRYDALPKDDLKYHFTTAIPIGTALAQSWDVEFVKDCGSLVSDEMKLYGVNLWLAPALNIHRNILCGRNFEYFSEDPVLSGEIASGITLGVQKYSDVGVTIKHFAANNQENNRYNSNSIVSERALREIYLKGFAIAIKKAKPKALMTSYNLLNGEHTSQNRKLLNDILRSEFGFDGLIMTDWITTGKFYDESSKHDTIHAHKIIKAGNELIMPGAPADYDDIMEALSQGKLAREDLLRCARRVYRHIQKFNS